VSERAVCIGTNYSGTSSALAGCENDAQDWAAELDRRGYEVTLLLGVQASRTGILGALERAVAATEYRDTLVATWSGHGSWIPDRDGDEADGRDEVICPDDYARAGMLADDDLYRVFSAVGHGERVVMISDSCHSGTLNRFAGPVEQSPPALKVPDKISAEEAEEIQERFAALIQSRSPMVLGPGMDVVPTTQPRRVRFLPPAEFLPAEALDVARSVQHAPARGVMRRGALVMSACSSSQVTYDAVIGGRPCGLFSHVALAALRQLPEGGSYRDWHRLIRAALPSVDYPDVAPQLDGTTTQKRWDALA
jgi:hypothetical protein